jgi:hypothetical protein
MGGRACRLGEIYQGPVAPAGAAKPTERAFASVPELGKVAASEHRVWCRPAGGRGGDEGRREGWSSRAEGTGGCAAERDRG